jgi:amyloid beta precursor protein binding protein 1
VGFYSAFSLQLPSLFPIVETHPDPDSIQDLRILNPWPELAAAAAKLKDLDSLDDHQHDHVPYLLLLLHYLEKWKESHGGSPPTGYKEKTEFRDLIRAGARTNNPQGGEENFDEAVAAVLKNVNPWTLSGSLRETFEMDQCAHITPTSDSFWIIASAVKSFYASHGVLPLPGSLPDMKARSADYISLQNIYKAKARKDLAEVVANVRSTETRFNGSSQSPPISEKEIETFCKNAAHIKVIRGRGIPRLRPDATHTIKVIRNSLENPDSLIPIFIALQALDALVTEYQETKLSPSSPPFPDDPTHWSVTLSNLLALLSTTDNALDDDTLSRIEMAVEEVKRAGGGELHNISSLTGGLVAQEALKVLTRQYVPLDNTCVFDGVGAKTEMFRL